MSKYSTHDPAPQQLNGDDLTEKIDVWAFGILMWEIVCEQVPWASKGNSLDALKRSVCSLGVCLCLCLSLSVSVYHCVSPWMLTKML